MAAINVQKLTAKQADSVLRSLGACVSGRYMATELGNNAQEIWNRATYTQLSWYLRHLRGNYRVIDIVVSRFYAELANRGRYDDAAKQAAALIRDQFPTPPLPESWINRRKAAAKRAALKLKTGKAKRKRNARK